MFLLSHFRLYECQSMRSLYISLYLMHRDSNGLYGVYRWKISKWELMFKLYISLCYMLYISYPLFELCRYFKDDFNFKSMFMLSHIRIYECQSMRSLYISLYLMHRDGNGLYWVYRWKVFARKYLSRLYSTLC